MDTIVQYWEQYIVPFARFLVPIAVLLVGWLVALVISALVRRLLRRTDLDNRLVRAIAGEEVASRVEAERWISKGVFYVLMLLVLVVFFQAIGLTVITDPLYQILTQITTFVPHLLSAGLLLLLAWMLASLLRMGIVRVLTAAKVDERLGESAGIEESSRLSIPQSVGNAVYWLIFLIFLPAVLGALGMEGLLQPVRDMLGAVMGFLPNLFAGGLILLVGWFVARIVQRIAANLLAVTGLDQMGERAGLGQALSGLAGRVVYTLILILAAIAALDALKFEAISAPASQMLATILNAVPGIFTAGLMLLIAYLVGRFVSGLLTDLLAHVGFNTVLARLGIGGEPAEGERTPSEMVGYLTLAAVLLFASIEAADLLGFSGLSSLLIKITILAGNVVLGMVIFGIGLYLADLIVGIVQQKRTTQSGLLTGAVRVAIVSLTTAMALRQMGIADEIINVAFGLLLGAIAVAIAIAFGLGSRDIAAREVEALLRALRDKEKKG